MEEVNKKLTFLDDDVKNSPIDEKTNIIKPQFLEESFISLNGYHTIVVSIKRLNRYIIIWTKML